MEQAIGFELNKAIVGEIQPKEALDNSVAAVKKIMEKGGFYKGSDPVSYASMEPGLWIGKGKTAPF
jgi:multiple sugar transport system substrate-binding protein